jgi:hypothetical protein
MRWWLVLAIVGGCGNEAKPTAASHSAGSASGSASPPSPPSVGWQSTSDGFVPDNSDVEALNKQQLENPADEDTIAEPTIRIRFGTETRELTAAELVKLPGAGSGGREERPLSAVMTWAFPDRAWKTLTLVDIKGGRTVVKRADVEAKTSTMRVRLNRRGALRVMVPDDVGPASAPTERGGGGRGVSRRLRTAVSDIELE